MDIASTIELVEPKYGVCLLLHEKWHGEHRRKYISVRGEWDFLPKKRNNFAWYRPGDRFYALLRPVQKDVDGDDHVYECTYIEHIGWQKPTAEAKPTHE